MESPTPSNFLGHRTYRQLSSVAFFADHLPMSLIPEDWQLLRGMLNTVAATSSALLALFAVEGVWHLLPAPDWPLGLLLAIPISVPVGFGIVGVILWKKLPGLGRSVGVGLSLSSLIMLGFTAWFLFFLYFEARTSVGP
jgi:hypothetical protein